MNSQLEYLIKRVCDETLNAVGITAVAITITSDNKLIFIANSKEYAIQLDPEE